VDLRLPQTIEAPPVVLRRYEGSELPSLIEAVTDSIDHLKPWMPWASADPLEPSLADFVSRAVEDFDHGENFNYAIWDANHLYILGGSGLHPRLGPGRLEIGYWVRDGWRRQGIATAAARSLTTVAFQMPGIEEVHIHCDEANLASAGIPRRLGFRLLRTVDDDLGAPGEIGRSMEWAMSRFQWVRDL
jgi:RimJ/RimL family protein N-acetyltransferase